MTPPVQQSRFVKEILLPGGHGTLPFVDSRFARFALSSGPSTIDRWGLFAVEQIPPLRVVIEYTGEWIGAEAAEYRALRQRNYLFELSKNSVIDGIMGGSGAQFVNHSCEPNLRFRVYGKRVFLVSLRGIDSGQELTVDYHLASDSEKELCHCGARLCRGFMNLP